MAQRKKDQTLSRARVLELAALFTQAAEATLRSFDQMEAAGIEELEGFNTIEAWDLRNQASFLNLVGQIQAGQLRANSKKMSRDQVEKMHKTTAADMVNRIAKKKGEK